jgi:hypothetical protein
MFFPRLQQALGEFRRVLRPDGRVGLSTWQRSQVEDLAEVLQALDLGGAAEPGWITEPAVLQHHLEAAGFRDVRVLVETTTFRYVDEEIYWQNARATGLGRFLNALDATQTERVRAAFADKVRGQRRADGLYLPATALLAVATPRALNPLSLRQPAVGPSTT